MQFPVHRLFCRSHKILRAKGGPTPSSLLKGGEEFLQAAWPIGDLPICTRPHGPSGEDDARPP
jgi:hypothetical protein